MLMPDSANELCVCYLELQAVYFVQPFECTFGVVA